MMKFCKKPVVIEAFNWGGSTLGLTAKNAYEEGARLWMPEWMPTVARVVTDEKWPANVPAGEVWRDGDDLWIGTLEGPHKASPGDWIIQGVAGEIYPCKPDIFETTYEVVT